jgi:hypothetical protein
MQYRIEQKLKASYAKLPELFQAVEKKGKCASSIARTVSRPKSRLDRTTKMIENNMLDRRFAVAPLMDWTESSSFSIG